LNAQKAATEYIIAQANAAGMNDFFVEPNGAVKVPGAGKNGAINGLPDIVGYDPDSETYYVWEVKIDTEEESAVPEAQNYIDYMKRSPEKFPGKIILGWQIGGPYPVILDTNKVWGYNDGAIIYGDYKNRTTRAPGSNSGGPAGTPGYVKIIGIVAAGAVAGLVAGVGGGGGGSGSAGDGGGAGGGASLPVGVGRGPLEGGGHLIDTLY
jgi:hypothetical protein